MCLFVIPQLLEHVFSFSSLLSASTKRALFKTVTFAEVTNEKNGTNSYDAMKKTARRRSKAIEMHKKALEVRTRCENAAATLTQNRTLIKNRTIRRTSKEAVSIKTAAKKFNISYSQLFRYVSYVVLLYYI